jgi:hypothetical protein
MSTQSSTKSQAETLRAENMRLKAELVQLHKTTGERTSPQNARISIRLIRSVAVMVLLAFAVALLVVGNLLFWFGNTVVKTDRFAAATQPIIKDPVVQQSIALYTTNHIFDNVDVEAITAQALPPRAEFLAPQLASQLKSATNSTLDKALAKPSLQEKWNTVLITQHDRFVTFASSYKGDGNVSLADAYDQVSASLGSTKLSFLANKKLPAKTGNITIIDATWLPTFHNVVVHIDTWRLLAILLLVASLAGAVGLSRHKRRTIYLFSIISAIMLLVSLIALRVTREVIAGNADPQYADGVRRVLQLFFHSLVIQTTTIILVAFLIALVAWISGSSPAARAVKRQISALFSGKLHEQLFSKDNTVTVWLRTYKRVVEWVLVAIFASIMLIIRLTPRSLLISTIVLLVLILVIETVAGKAPERRSSLP